MAPTDHERLTDLFLKAVDLAPGERAAFLDEACAGDGELRGEVESLLQSDAAVPAILREGLIPPGAARHPEEPHTLPERIGPYRILEEVGEGGMGVVYRAEQEEPLRRMVALKVIRLGIATRQVIARFESERQVLARMDHPNVARVLDAGTAGDGRPYFAMEFVEGEPITNYCDRKRFSLHERLALFREVCEGVQHAHQNAVIHRDLKPSNVLVTERDGEPVPKIIDFGIAKAVEQTPEERSMFTQAGQVLGTLEYMSPEQAALDNRLVDTRTDIYSLGVLLYELITGVLPFDRDALRRSSFDEVRHRVREVEPPRPSTRVGELGATGSEVAAKRGTDRVTLRRRLKGDLNWIVMKALEKDPERRYASAAGLSTDLERYLSHEPVRARPPSFLYRFRKLARKHRAAAAVGTVLALAALAVGISQTIQAARVARASAQAAEQAAVAEQVSEFLIGLFGVSPGSGPRPAGGDAWDTLSIAVDRARHDLAHRPRLQARLLVAMGNVYRRLGAPWKGQPLLAEARASLLELGGPDHPALLEATLALGGVHEAMGRFPLAESLYQEVIETRQRTLGEEHLETLRAWNHLGYLYKTWDRDAESEAIFRRTTETLGRTRGERDRETLIAKNLLIGMLMDLGRYDEARALLIEQRRDVPAVLGERHFEMTVVLYNLACVNAMQGRRQEALELLREVILERGFGYGSSILGDEHLEALRRDPELERLAWKAWLNQEGVWARAEDQARLLVLQGKEERAAELYSDLLEATERKHASSDEPELTTLKLELARLYLLQSRYAEAEELLLTMEEFLGEGERAGWWERAQIDWMLGECRLGMGDGEGARELMGRVLDLYEDQLPEHSRELAYSRAARAMLDGDRDTALRLLHDAADWGYPTGRNLERDLFFRELRDEPEFREIVAEVKARFREE